MGMEKRRYLEQELEKMGTERYAMVDPQEGARLLAKEEKKRRTGGGGSRAVRRPARRGKKPLRSSKRSGSR